MDFNFDLNLVQSQKLLLTPQLRQAIEILKMNSQELFEYVEEQLEANPVMELADTEENPYEDNLVATVEQMEWEDSIKTNRTLNSRDDEGFDDIIDLTVDKASMAISLKEHLLLQLHTSSLDEKQMAIGEYFIDNTDENGYLLVNVSEAAAYFNLPAKKVTGVLEHLQEFDPPGICARSLKECLLIQLRQLGNVDEKVVKVVENHLDDLAENRVAVVAKSIGESFQKVSRIFEFVKTLEPRPGRAFYNNEDIKYIVPDVIVKKIKNKFEVLINEDSFPAVSINKYYSRMLSDEVGTDVKKYVQGRIDSAEWLIKCIEQRKETIRKVAERIVEKQAEFFEKGRSAIKPLTMKAVASEIDMHESTVSRTVNGKYLQCCWGVFEMRFFFTGKVSASSGEDVSVDNIKLRIKSLIEAEDKKEPLSDNDIAEILAGEGFEISRRTVAKYRGEIGLAAAAKRRKF